MSRHTKKASFIDSSRWGAVALSIGMQATRCAACFRRAHFASLLYFEEDVKAALKTGQLSEVHDTVMHHSFGTKDKEWLQDHPEHETKSIYTPIDKLEKSYGITGLRAGYDGLSERCHPNMAGHQFFFGTLNHETGTVTYTETKREQQNLNMALGAVLLLGLAESSLNRLDQLTPKISELSPHTQSAQRIAPM